MTSSRLLRRLKRRFRILKAKLLRRNRRNINSKIRVVHQQVKSKRLEYLLSSLMEAGNAASARTITLKEGKNAIDAKSQGPPRIFVANLLI